nr:tetratricopeptide repeat protein [Herbaspirillum sp. ASV7]
MSHAGELAEFMAQTFEEAFRLHAAGQLAEAEQEYRILLELDAEHAAALHYLGILMHQTGRHDEALESLRRAAELAPQQADWRNDQGNVLFACQRYGEAVAAYREALALRPDDAQFWNNCGAALRQQGEPEQAIDALLRALELAPQLAPAMLQLAALHEQSGDRMQASRYQCQAYILPPHEGKSPEMLAISYYFLGQVDQAAEVCRQWLADEPANPVARHMLDAYAGAPATSASLDYIARRFDDYADNFDHNLVDNLQYRGPQILARLLEGALGPARPALDILDVGCGTGLCAPVLAPRAHRLDGVDLSANMLRYARERGSYHQLVQAEASDWMEQQGGQYDLVAACDVVIYCGGLDRFFAATRHALREGGYFIFTAETAQTDEEITGQGYALHPSGRFRHRRDYLQQGLRAAGFRVVLMQEESLRVEMQQPVPGLVVLARA